MDPCNILYHEGCPCEYSPEFKEIEAISGRQAAIEQTGCQPSSSSESKSLPFAGKASEFGGSTLQDALKAVEGIDVIITGFMAVSVVAFFLFKR